MIPKFRCFDKDTKTMHEVVAIDFKDWRVYYEAYGLRSYWNKNGITPAGAGKSYTKTILKPRKRDHPRRCG